MIPARSLRRSSPGSRPPIRPVSSSRSSLSTDELLSAGRFHVENLGCAKNQVDAEVMIAALERSGRVRCDDPAGADLILVNTCAFIESARRESIDATLALLSAFPAARLVMTGCLSQRYPEEIAAEMPELSGVFGNREPARIAEFLDRLESGGDRVMVPSGRRRGTMPDRTHLLSLPGSAFVKVSEGCDNRCSFCAIPLIRGPLRSRPADQVVAEIERLLERGVREINLVAQDLAGYGPAVELLERLSRLSGEFWVRLLYVYPERFPPEFLDLAAAEPRILPYFDIPFQHASAVVLELMRRPGSAGEYLELVERIRARLPDAFLRTTLLVGFFGEDEAAFEELLAFQAAARIDWLGVFPYSPEEGTPAMRGNPRRPVSAREAERRAALVREAQQAITFERIDRLVGRTLDVLVEELVLHEPLAIGRCYAQAPEVDGAVVVHRDLDASASSGRPAVEPGRFVRCRITRRNGLDVEAVPL